MVSGEQQFLSNVHGVPDGIRTHVTGLRGRDPRPLDDRDRSEGSGTRTRVDGLKGRYPDHLEDAPRGLRAKFLQRGSGLDDALEPLRSFPRAGVLRPCALVRRERPARGID